MTRDTEPSAQGASLAEVDNDSDAGDARHLAQERGAQFGIAHEVHQPDAHDEVDRAIREGELRQVEREEPRACVLAARLEEHRERGIAADIAEAEAGQEGRKAARTARYVEHALDRWKRGQRAQDRALLAAVAAGPAQTAPTLVVARDQCGIAVRGELLALCFRVHQARGIVAPMWTPIRTADGSWTLRCEELAQACHSLSGAWEQARLRYAEPCRVRETGLEHGVVRLLDIGTGIGLNLAAALASLQGTGARLEAVTIERDPTVLARARGLADWPAEVEPWLRLAHRALDGEAVDGVSLRLLVGDARELLPLLEERPFDAVFLDPFSPQVAPELWSESFLRSVAQRMAPEAVLSTYSASFPVRLALARAGLAIGRGPRVGAKAEGTLASFRRALPALEGRLQRRLERRRHSS